MEKTDRQTDKNICQLSHTSLLSHPLYILLAKALSYMCVHKKQEVDRERERERKRESGREREEEVSGKQLEAPKA